MAVVSVNLIEQRGNDNDRGVRTYTDTYLVKCSGLTDNPFTVKASGLLPQPFDAHQDDAIAFVKSRDAVQNKAEENATLWTVTIEYGTDCEDPRYAVDDPMDEPTRWSRKTLVEDEFVIEEDITGAPIINTVGDAFDPPFTRPKATVTWTAIKNYPEFDEEEIESYIDTKNSEVFLDKPAGTIRCNAIDVEEAYKNGVLYYVYTFSFQYKEEGWNLLPLNEGYYALDEPDGTKYRVLDDQRQPLQTTTKLYEDGTAIDPDNLPGDAHYLDFEVLENADFNDFGLT